MLHSSARRALFLALLLSLNGCGSGPSESLVEVSGQVVSEGKPFKIYPEERLTVLFCKIDEAKQPTDKSYPATVDRKGHFTASVAPGKYRIVLHLKKGTRDNFKNAYNATNSPFIREVHGGESFTIDLKKPGG